MSEEIPIPEGEVKEGRGFSMIWIIPIVAAIVAAGLAYRTISERGPLISITFKSGEGLEADATTLQYRSVPFGRVESVELSEDAQSVVVHARLQPGAASHITEGTRFWVVRPRIGASGISGLSTLLSGAYIAVKLGPPQAAKTRSFEGLEDPPLVLDDPDALMVVMDAHALRDLSSGSPVYYRDIEVGTIVGHDLDAEGTKVTVHVAIGHDYALLVYENTHFWNVGGFEVDASFSGVEMNLQSLRSLMMGGIAFDTHGPPGAPAKSGAHFPLYEGPTESKRAWKRARTRHIVLEGKTLGSIRAGESVLYHGVEVGTVLSYELKKDAASIGVLLGIEPEYAPLVRANSVFWNASGFEADIGLTGIHVHTESLAALVSGAVAFATPDLSEAPAASGSVFRLHDEPKESWRKWRPHIWLGPASKRPQEGPVAAARADEKPQLVHHQGADPAEQKESHHWWSDLFHSEQH